MQGNQFGHRAHVVDSVSRRTFLRTAAVGGAAAFVGSGPFSPTPARGAQPKAGMAKPIPFGENLGVGPSPWHLYNAKKGVENSSIYDFDGLIGSSFTTGTGIRTQAGVSQPFDFTAGMRFMSGTYVDEQGVRRTGTFHLI